MKPDVCQRPTHFPIVRPRKENVRKRRICTGLLVLLGLGLVGCDDTPLTDLNIRNLRVTQSAPGDSSPAVLISQRLTTVRAVLTSDASYDVTGVVGTLSVAVEGAIIMTDVAAINGPITIPAHGKGSLDFILEAPTGISASRDVDFFVSLSAPSQFLEGKVFDLTFDSPSVATVRRP